MTDTAEIAAEVAHDFNMSKFTNSLIDDLALLREGKISIEDARARALLAKHILRSVHLVIMGRKFIEQAAPMLASGDPETSQVQNP